MCFPRTNLLFASKLHESSIPPALSQGLHSFLMDDVQEALYVDLSRAFWLHEAVFHISWFLLKLEIIVNDREVSLR